MDLVIDIGNSTIKFGLFSTRTLLSVFEINTNNGLKLEDFSSLFHKNIYEKNYKSREITRAICSSVVPEMNFLIKAVIRQYFDIETWFLQSDILSDIKINCKPEKNVGADRIAAATGAASIMPGKNLIVVDMGTVTARDAVIAGKEFAGGTIIPGLSLSAQALASGTAKLPSIKIERPAKVYGTTTGEAILSGIYYGQAGAIKEICRMFQKEIFNKKKSYIIATGGTANLFEGTELFDVFIPELVLIGLQKILEQNI